MKTATALSVATTTDAKTGNAKRSLRRRARRQSGLRCFTVTVDEEDLKATLCKARNFSNAELGDRQKIEAELSEVLALWFERWLRTGHD